MASGFQLNCYTTQNEYSAWQQYILSYDPSQSQNFAGQVDNWTTTAEILNSGLIWFCPIEGPTPAGTLFGITLSFDPSTKKVIGVKFTATLPGKPQAPLFLTLSNLKTDAGPKENISQMSPIVAFQARLRRQRRSHCCAGIWRRDHHLYRIARLDGAAGFSNLRRVCRANR